MHSCKWVVDITLKWLRIVSLFLDCWSLLNDWDSSTLSKWVATFSLLKDGSFSLIRVRGWGVSLFSEWNSAHSFFHSKRVVLHLTPWTSGVPLFFEISTLSRLLIPLLNDWDSSTLSKWVVTFSLLKDGSFTLIRVRGWGVSLFSEWNSAHSFSHSKRGCPPFNSSDEWSFTLFWVDFHSFTFRERKKRAICGPNPRHGRKRAWRESNV